MKVGQLYREKLIDLLKSRAEDTEAILFINFKGLNSLQLNILRASLKEKNARLLVAKNKLIRKAFPEKAEDLGVFLKEETGIVYSSGDIVEATKTLFNFIEENEKLQIKGGFIGEKPVDKKKLQEISGLPSMLVLLGMAVNCIASPLTSLVGSLNQIILKFVWAIEEIKKQKEKK